MRDLIEYICQLFSIEIKSNFAMLDMENDISSISDHAEYAKYLKQYFNLIDLQYMTGYQKYIELTKRYKQAEAERMNAERLAKMSSAAERLALKVKEIDTMVLNNQASDPQWHHFKLSTGEQYFSEKETKALSSIGGPLACVKLQRKISGRDLLAERLEEIFIERVVAPQLEVPQNNVTALVQNLTEGVRS